MREDNLLDESISPLAFDFDNKTLYVASNIGRDKNAVYTYDPETDQLGDMIFSHDEVDVTGLHELVANALIVPGENDRTTDLRGEPLPGMEEDADE